MGAVYNSVKIKATREALEKRFLQLQDALRYEMGHGGYTGTLAECDGLIVTDLTFNTEDEANTWLDDNTEKWESAKAVRVGNDWIFGGWCST